VLVFIDSDCVAPANWLCEIKAAFDADPGIEAFGGPDDASADFPPLSKAISYSMTSFITTGGMRGGRGKQKRLAKYYPRSFNMGLRRELFDQIGGFGNLRHGQDIEFSHRIIRSGAWVAYIPNAVVYHRRRDSLASFFRQVFKWGVARVNLYRIDQAMLEPVHIAPAIAFWLAALMTLLAVLSRPLLALWGALVVIVCGVLAGCGVHAAGRWRDGRIGLLVPVVMICQVSGYGLGFTWALLSNVVLRQSGGVSEADSLD
jgi:cellulose synthase/poly-beta-1,6-N-acetylglucosamine synthase-like glycosyltransferase